MIDKQKLVDDIDKIVENLDFAESIADGMLSYIKNGPPLKEDNELIELIESIKTKNGLRSPIDAEYEDAEIIYANGSDEIILHSAFTAQQLRELAEYMDETQ